VNRIAQLGRSPGMVAEVAGFVQGLVQAVKAVGPSSAAAP
jgi:hypothetical protein